MKGKDLLAGMSFVDEKVIQEAEQERIARRSPFKWIIPIAACVALIIGSTLWGKPKNHLPKIPQNDTPPKVSQEVKKDQKKYVLHFNEADNIADAKLAIDMKNYFSKEVSEKQAKILLPSLFKKYQMTGNINYLKVKGKVTIFSVDTHIKSKKREDVLVTIAPNRVIKDYVIMGKKIYSKIEGVKVDAGVLKSESIIYYANFKIDDIAYYVEYKGKKNDKAFFTEIVADIILGGKANLSKLSYHK